MKNRILRSALSVALCAAMLLSQGLTAFADGEIDLAAAKSSPVQESLEELVPGASDLKPEIKNVVLPQRAARSAAPEIETYSIPDSSGYTEILGYQALVDDCELHVYINGTDSQNPSGNIELTDSNDVETTFPQGTGFRIFEASPSENWIFDEWQTHIYLKKLIDENTIDSENHSSAGKTAFEPSGNSILVNRLAALGETIFNKVYYSVYANFNPTVSVTVNGASQDEAVFIYPNNKVENTGRYEVDYGDGITITANEGYKITGMTVDGTSAEVEDDGSYTLSNVIEPHDIVVTVEKTGEEPEISEPTPEQLGDLIGDIGVCCKSYSAHETRWYPIRALTRNSDYTISLNPVEKTCSVTLSVDALCSRFNDNFNSTHTPCQEDVTIRLIWADGKWSLAEEITPPVMIDTTCAPDTPMLPDLSKIEELLDTMAVTCVNPNHNVTETYDITWDSIGGLDKAPTANGNGTYSLEITVSHNTYLTLFNQTYPNHKWATDDDMENEKVTLIWKNGEWSVEGKTDFSFNVLCDTKAPVEPTKPESDVLDPIIGSVSVKCVTNEKHTSSWSYLTSQLTEGSDYTIGELGNENGKVTCTITYIAKAFADKYNELQTNIDHFPFNDVAVKLVWNDETSSWELENKNLLNNVLVSVGCVLSEEEILADNLSVMVDCISDLNHEDLTGLSLEKGTFSIDEPYQIAGEYFFDIEVQPDSYLKKYAEEHPTYPEHSGNAVKLTYQWKDTNWEPTISEISFKVTCEGPNIPSHEDVIKLLGGTMTVHCVNTNHNATETYGITWDSIGGLNKAPTDNGDGTYSLEITVSHDTYLKLFNQTYPNHKWATDDDMENEKVTLIWKDGEWSVEDKTDFSFNVDCNATAPGGDENPDNPGGGDNGNNGGNNNGGSTGGGSSVSRRDDDDDWEPLPNNNYRVTKKNDKPSQNTQIVVRDPADNSDNTSSNTGSDSGKYNPETGDTTTAFAAMALAAVSLGGVVLLGRKKK